MHRLPNRQSQRLKGYDYSRNGFYFVTIVCQNQTERFGNIVNGEMVLNDAGRMVESVWLDIPEQYNIGIDVYVIMPNHFHGIVVNVGTPLVGVRNPQNEPDSVNGGQGQAQSLQKKTIGDIVGAFKSITTNRYIKGVKLGLVPPFQKKLWQGRFYDHIIRNEKEFMAIEQYILHNPRNWEQDRLRKREGMMEERALYGNNWEYCH